MRLSDPQINAIREAARKVFGAGTRIWLFGSRANDEARGGDIAFSSSHQAQRPIPWGTS